MAIDFPGEKLIIKLWETLAEKGVGGLLKPWQMRREGDARNELQAKERILLAQADYYAEQIRSGQLRISGGATGSEPIELSGPPPPAPSPNNSAALTFNGFEVVQRRVFEDTARQEVNVAKAILHAEEELRSKANEPSSKTIDADWLYRWRAHAGAVSNEDLQLLWGKVLAGEVVNPGAISLRVLDFLKNLDMAEAKMIETLSPYLVGDVIPKYDDMLERFGIPYVTLMHMESIGILSGVGTLGLMRKREVDADATTGFPANDLGVWAADASMPG